MADLCCEFGLEFTMSGAARVPRQWANKSRKTDRDDALKPARLLAPGRLADVARHA
jgi:hypothetical protein